MTTPELTLRQYLVLFYIADGVSNRAIAARLQVSVDTVSDESTAIRDALGARTAANAIAKAFRAGLLGHADYLPSDVDAHFDSLPEGTRQP